MPFEVFVIISAFWMISFLVDLYRAHRDNKQHRCRCGKCNGGAK